MSNIIQMPSAMISTRHCPMTATDAETTGFAAGYHEICEVAFVVLNSDLEPDQHFYMRIRPKYPERCDPKAMRVHGIPLSELQKWPTSDIVLDMFDDWFKSLNLPLNKKLTPLCHNWSFDKGFYEDFFGHELMRRYFSLPRDTLRVAVFMNDRACFRCEQFPFPESCQLKDLCKRLGVPYEGAHNALSDSLMTAKVYKELLRRG